MDGIYADIFAGLDSALRTHWMATASNIAFNIKPVCKTLLLIYVTLWGWSMMRGVIQEPISDGVGRIVRLTVIYFIAINMLYYNQFIGDFLWESPDELAKVVAGGYANTNDRVTFLDKLLDNFYAMFQAYDDKAVANASAIGNIPDLTLWFIGAVIWVIGVLLTGYAAFLFILAKTAIAILLGVGPIFVIMTFFEGTKRFFDAWLGQVLNYVFLVMLTSCAVMLIMSIIQVFMTSPAVTGKFDDPSLLNAIPAIAYGVIGVLVMLQIPSMASALGGGVAISTLGAVSVAFGATARGVAAGGKAIKDRLSGKTKEDKLTARREAAQNKTKNAAWVRNNPGMVTRAARAVADKFRGGNSVKRA
ncbi:MAG: type IV secretion system protein [Candidatus Accumulibacter sp.]|jgi:type IV secretion system protein VirB6|nr:type IV secretion system protein [Accumulibacter sp.]